MYIILNWSCLDDLSIVLDEYGEVRVFDTENEAEEYAEDLNWNWKIVKLEEG
jgi:hypothetical protein